jgi:hypothetical protein
MHTHVLDNSRTRFFLYSYCSQNTKVARDYKFYFESTKSPFYCFSSLAASLDFVVVVVVVVVVDSIATV